MYKVVFKYKDKVRYSTETFNSKDEALKAFGTHPYYSTVLQMTNHGK